MGLPDEVPGNHCYLRHGFTCENVAFQPDWWHTGENWYLNEGDSGGALIYAVTEGVVVFTGSDYPGRVIVIEHAGGLYSMYGHLDYDLPVSIGEVVSMGQVIGSVLYRTDGRSPSHLHFELRDWHINPEVNGDSPRYDYPCGYNCSPGPGYWPMSDEQLPVEMGWRNPTHVLQGRALAADYSGQIEVVVDVAPLMATTTIYDQPGNLSSAEALDELNLHPGDRYPLLAIVAGDEQTQATAAEAYQVWHQIEFIAGEAGWVRGVVPSDEQVGNDGRAVALRVNFHLVPPN